MEEIFAIALGILLFAWLLASLLCLPVLVVILARRLAAFETRLRRLEQPAAAPRAEEPAVSTIGREEAVSALVVPDVPAAQPESTLVPSSPSVPAGAPIESLDVAWEAWLGRRALGWVAVVLLLFAAAFFLKQVFENRWVGETGRVAIGVFFGVALCLAGFRYHRRGWRVFSQMLTAGGIVLIYLSTFGAFGYYHLLPREQATVFLVVLIAESALLAVLYDAPAIAVMALVGALLAPVLLRSEHDQYRSLFLYLATVDAGALLLILYRAWPALGTLALLGTHALFWTWFDTHFHPEKRTAAACFQIGLFLLFLAYSSAAHLLRRRRAGVEDLLRLVLNAALFFAAMYTLFDVDYHVWMGTLAIGMAITYTLLGWVLVATRPTDLRHFLVAAAVAMGFVATVFPLEAGAVWICLGWAVEGLVLWWFGVRGRMPLLGGMGAVLLLMAVWRLLFVDTAGGAHHEPFVPLLNGFGTPALAVAACLLAAALLGSRCRGTLTDFDRVFAGLAGLGGLVLVWFILSLESYDYFLVRIPQPATLYGPGGEVIVDPSGRPLYEVTAEQAQQLRRIAQMVLSLVWAVYAAVVLGLGFWLRRRAMRWMALALFAATLAKVILVDMSGLPGFYRVATFFALSVMMAVAAWAYQRMNVRQT
ncbi:MAG: DUF2339 domain-containing protein [Thermoguttaceae bacterium]